MVIMVSRAHVGASWNPWRQNRSNAHPRWPKKKRGKRESSCTTEATAPETFAGKKPPRFNHLCNDGNNWDETGCKRRFKEGWRSIVEPTKAEHAPVRAALTRWRFRHQL